MKAAWLAALALLAAISTQATAGLIDRRIYPAPTVPLAQAKLALGARLVNVTTSDGLTLTGIAVAAKPGMPLLLVFHGNASSAADVVQWFAPAIARGYGVIAGEYRGYSANPGRPSEAGLARDADAFAAYARSQASGGPLWLVGHSLGGGVALGLAQRARFDAVVTIGTFTRLRAMVPGIARAFVPDGYDNRAAMGRLGHPFFLVHGTRDDTVPLSEGRALHAAAGAAKQPGASFIVIGSDHRPSGALLTHVFDAIARWSKDGRFDVQLLPSEIKLVPFGAETALNP